MVESVLPLYPGQEETINDLSSGLFNMFLGIGQVAGPLYGAMITDKYGYQTCCDSVAFISLTYALLYYWFTDGKSAFQNSRWVNITTEMEDEGMVSAPVVLIRTGICTPCSNPS